MTIYARARDGALYKNPVLVFDEGFVCFDTGASAELILWLEIENDAVKDQSPTLILDRVLGEYWYDPNSLVGNAPSERVRPGSEPWIYTPAVGYFFDVTRRIPRPSLHEGTERYASRCNSPVLEWERHAHDVLHLEVGGSDAESATSGD